MERPSIFKGSNLHEILDLFLNNREKTISRSELAKYLNVNEFDDSFTETLRFLSEINIIELGHGGYLLKEWRRDKAYYYLQEKLEYGLRV